MDTKSILIDSSIIIDYFRKKRKEKTPLYHLFQKDYLLFISALTVYELLCGTKSQQLQQDTQKILELFTVLDFGTIEAEEASVLYKELKKQNKLIDTIDILIAATALTHSLKIVTLNRDHFIRFQNLRMIELCSKQLLLRCFVLFIIVQMSKINMIKS